MRRRSKRPVKRRVRRYVRRSGTRRLGTKIRNVLTRMAEPKYSFTVVANTFDIAAGLSNNFSPQIVQGTGLSNRIGNEITMKSCSVRLLFNCSVTTNGDTAVYEPQVRIIVGLFKMIPVSGALGTIGILDVLDVNNIYSKVNSEVFTVWKDKIVTLSPNTWTYTGWKSRLKLWTAKKMKLNWAFQTANTVNSPQYMKISPIVIVLSDFNSNTQAGKVTGTLSGLIRWNYIDV